MAVCAMDWKRFWWALIALESECEAARVGSGAARLCVWQAACSLPEHVGY